MLKETLQTVICRNLYSMLSAKVKVLYESWPWYEDTCNYPIDSKTSVHMNGPMYIGSHLICSCIVRCYVIVFIVLGYCTKLVTLSNTVVYLG